MSRLIDADALKTVMHRRHDLFSGCTNPPEKARRDELVQVIVDINNAPTIDAIPVEWLTEKANDAPNQVMQAAIDFLLIVWKNEQGARS